MWTPEWVLSDGEIIRHADARIHPLSLAVTYATTVFEGLRAYRRPEDGSYSFFRLREHIERLQVGMKVMRFDRRIEVDEMQEALSRLVRANSPDTDVYIRLLVFISGIGLMATRGPVSYFAVAQPRDKPKFAETGMQLGVSSWSRLSDNASPPRIKATANYHNARLTQLQAQADGYDGAIMLTSQGKVSEAPIACFFMVRDGELITPNLGSSILESVTRDSIIRLYERRFGRPVIQREVDRSELYFAQEAFICGTGQEIIPVTSIDRLPVGDGKPGEITRRVQAMYFECVRRMVPDEWGWHTPLL
ncbi:Branched-chain-amino-acid aminotransferase [Variovorax sp. PBL-H6]|uniref:aminotransferase class IV n=1 Tax=Variovorax sp. PBL-H6 TaxID=434009 RepID=UPI001316BBF5|nr:aminotransferase class IV [Variovorax sp. PBL-H6]VTU25642.1 Branched-chain-amino-acid aminotransferase [Variovorax sp. PBL-H6]